jgi:rod shape determining protein RodA
MSLRRAPEPLHRWDWILLGLVLALGLVGVLLIISATAAQPELRQLPWRQLLWMLGGGVLMAALARLDYQGVVEKGYGIYGLTALLLLLLLFTAKRSSYGAASWFNLRFFYLQPAELAKLALVLALARWLSEHDRELATLRGLLPPLGLAGLMMFLILRQPDLGTALVMLPITVSMLWVAGARVWHLSLLAGLGVGAAPLLWPFLKEYQKNRILTFLDPGRDALGAGYNAIQSQIAVGSGGLFGQGYLRGTQSQLHFVPFHHTDFVFSVLAEEWGLVGSLVVLALLLGLFARLAGTAMRARQLSGALVCTGLLAWLGTQTIINIGMTLGLLPVTGLPLPLISYGGSSTVAAMAGLGLVLSVRRDSLIVSSAV